MATDVDMILRLTSISTGYGAKQVLRDASVAVPIGAIVALIGHNGAGKSTLLKAAFGLLPLWNGEIEFLGRTLHCPTPAELLRIGVAYCPQGHRVFTELSVRENLEMAAFTLRAAPVIDEAMSRILVQFPSLQPMLHRLAAVLSGGERQILAIACALICSPRLLLLDEPSLGLAPATTAAVFAHLEQISKSSNVSILIAEQKVREVLKIAQNVNILRAGQIAFSGTPESVASGETLRRFFL